MTLEPKVHFSYYKQNVNSSSGVGGGAVGVNIGDFFEFNHAPNTRGYAYKLLKSRSVNNIRQFFFAERIVNVWDGLLPSVSFPSLSTFRRTIQKVDFSQFMKCT